MPLTTFAAQPNFMFSNLKRSQKLAALSKQKFDLLIVGGGITGVGIALDAVARGMTVALVEKQDFAAGTSSRSTKLVHGGLRYLKQLDFELVREVGRERAIVFRNAPHLVYPEKMVLPIVQGGSLGRLSTSFALRFYEWLAQVPKEDQRKMYGKQDALREEPLLKSSDLKGAAIYSEYRTDDARLVMEVAKTATEKGAFLLNHCELLDFAYKEGKVIGATVKDQIAGTKVLINADQVVNATGPWVDNLRSLERPVSGKRLHLTKGIHLVFERERIPLRHSIYFDVGDGRMVFAVTRDSSTYVGTTDTNYNGPLERPAILDSEVEYLLNAANRMLNIPALSRKDVRSSWAGLRPLIHEDGKSPSELSRKDEVFKSDSGLISIAGGKLTGYRMMAKRTVDLVCSRMKNDDRPSVQCTTDQIKLSGSDFNSIEDLLAKAELKSIPMEQAQALVRKYGSNIEHILNYLDRFTAAFPLTTAIQLAELTYCVEHEMVAELSDFLIRRTGNLYFNRESTLKNLEILNDHLASLFNWDDERKELSLEHCRQEYQAVLDFR